MKNLSYCTTSGWPAWLLAASAGLLFAIGLSLSGMTQAAKVLGFLNLAALATGPFPGAWDPSLAFVMGGAVSVTLVAFAVTPRPGKTPWCAPHFELPTQERVDAPLLQGACLFGVGWGLAGYCPGPAFAVLGSGNPEVLWFVPAMLCGMALARAVRR